MPLNNRFLTALLLGAMPLIGNGHASVLTISQPVRIMCIGDSITEGKNLHNGGYRKPLQDLLRQTGYSLTYVGKEDDGTQANKTGFSGNMDNANHEGYGSFRIDEILNGGSEEGRSAPPIAQTLASYHPDVILVMLGTNDILQNHEIGTIGQRVEKLIDTIFSTDKSITIVLAQITPLPGGRDAAAVAYNAQISDLVAKEKAQGHGIVLADMHSALNSPADFLGSVHPTQQGYNKMAAVWYEALTGQKAPTIGAPSPGVTSASGLH